MVCCRGRRRQHPQATEKQAAPSVVELSSSNTNYRTPAVRVICTNNINTGTEVNVVVGYKIQYKYTGMLGCCLATSK